jgi:hypothetical protein
MKTRVAGGDDLPAIRQAVIADAPIEDERIRRYLQALIGRGEFVEEGVPSFLLPKVTVGFADNHRAGDGF